MGRTVRTVELELLRAVVSVCKQYGPGQLPCAHRRDVGAGDAMATVTAITTSVFVLSTQLVGFSTVTSATMSMTSSGTLGRGSNSSSG